MKKILMLALASTMVVTMSVSAFAAHYGREESLGGKIVHPEDTIEFYVEGSGSNLANCYYIWDQDLYSDGYYIKHFTIFPAGSPYLCTVLDPANLTDAGFPPVGAGYWFVLYDELSVPNGDRSFLNFLWVEAEESPESSPAVAENSFTEQEQDFWQENVLDEAFEAKPDAETGERIVSLDIPDCYDSIPVGIMDTLHAQEGLTLILKHKGEEIRLNPSKLPKSQPNRAFYPIEYLIEIAGV